jgi:hypothetical protein
VTLFGLSNNSDVEVIGSLCAPPTCRLLVPLSLPLSFLFLLQTRYVRSIDSLSCADTEGHRQRIIGTYRTADKSGWVSVATRADI